MNHEVIARKYRPAMFKDLTGQEHISRTLQNSLLNGRLHHAYLFSGVRGTGKTTTARILAKGLNCFTGVTNQPCLECPSCREVAAGNSIDVIEIDAASHTGVDNVRDVIINSVAFVPARDRYKVFVIDEVHRLSGNAFDALLKTLEEPPPHVLFILATTEFHKLPETILSRCQHFEFRQISVEKIFARLKEIVQAERVTINETALREIARAGGGSLRDALSSLDQVIAFAGLEIADADVSAALGLVAFDLLETTINAIADSRCDKVFEVASELELHGSDLRNFARQLMATLRNLLVIKSGIKDADILGVAEQEVFRLEALASKFSEEEVVRSFHLMTEVEKEIKESPFPRFALELGLVKIAGATRLEPLANAVDRLEALESRLRTDQVPARTTSPPVTPISRRTNVIEPAASQDFDLQEMSEPVDFIETPEPLAQSSKFNARVQMVIDELARQNRTPLIIALHDAKDVDVDANRLVVTFEGESAFSSRLRDSQTLFGEIGQKLFSQPLRIEVRAGQGSITATVPPQSKRDRMRELALQNPAVRLAADKLRAEIIDVRETGSDPEG